MAKLTLHDLDIENHEQKAIRETKEDIVYFRGVLGKFTVRDSVEAYYGSDYANHMLGEDGGKDILVEELSVSEDIREAAGKTRRDVGANRLPTKGAGMSASDRRRVVDQLAEQTRVTDAAIVESQDAWVADDAKRLREQKINNDIANMLPETREEFLRQLQLAINK